MVAAQPLPLLLECFPRRRCHLLDSSRPRAVGGRAVASASSRSVSRRVSAACTRSASRSAGRRRGRSLRAGRPPEARQDLAQGAGNGSGGTQTGRRAIGRVTASRLGSGREVTSRTGTRSGEIPAKVPSALWPSMHRRDCPRVGLLVRNGCRPGAAGKLSRRPHASGCRHHHRRHGSKADRSSSKGAASGMWTAAPASRLASSSAATVSSRAVTTTST